MSAEKMMRSIRTAIHSLRHRTEETSIDRQECGILNGSGETRPSTLRWR